MTIDPQMMEVQIKLEERMASLGIEKYREDYHRNLANGMATDSRSVSTAMDYAIDPLAKAIEAFRAEAASGKAGRRHSAVKAIEGMEAPIVAFITLKLVLDGLMRDHDLTPLAVRVGGYLETEQRVRTYATKNRAAVEKVVRNLDSRTNHGAHRRRVLSHVMQTEEDNWKSWTTREKVAIGTKLIELVVLSTGLMTIDHTTHNKRRRCVVGTTERFRTWLATLNSQSEFMLPEFMPCVVPPKDWDSPTGGGYYSDAFVNPLRLVKTRSKRHQKILEGADLSTVYKAVNAIQRTPWAVNTAVLDVAEHFMTVGSGIAGLPSDVRPLPTKPVDIETNEEARKNWRRMAAMVYEENTALQSRRVQAYKTLTTAREFGVYRAIYFPHQLDFRGRIYSVPSGLTPQGTDLAKGLLTFSEGEAIDTAEAHRWFLIHGANTYGVDKVSFDDRCAWVAHNTQAIINTALNPYDDLFWTEADSPFCFLAWAMEYAESVKNPEFKSRLAIAMDGSCNGLQHYSAMLRDPIAGRAVNLMPSDTPRDIYGVVAESVMENLAAMCRAPVQEPVTKEAAQELRFAELWLSFGIDRKITKRPVMVLPYGGTLSSCQKYVADAVVSRGNLPFNDDEVSAACNWLSSRVWEAIGSTVTSARLAMGWLRQTAGAVIKAERELKWTTPSGFPVFQYYPEMKETQMETVLFGERFRPVISEEISDKPDRRRQVNGVAPNFVHSLDASALVLTVCAAVDRGLTKFAMIHDSYGTTAAQSATLAFLIRSEFVDMYESYDALEQFAQSVIPEGLIEGVDLPPFVGGLNLEEVNESLYFFA